MFYTVTKDPARDCPLCGTQYSRVADSVKERIYSCDYGCGAYETISKGQSSWWYHGAKLPENMTQPQLDSRARAFDSIDAERMAGGE